MPDVSWDDFRLVKAVAAARSLSGAAGALGVNPSTVFRRLGEAEAALGAKLFERHRTGYALTAAGEEMAALAERFDEEATAFSLRLAGRAVQPSGELRITTNDTLLVHLLTPLLAAFRRQCVDITLDVVLSNQALNLSKRDADIAVRATDAPPETLVGRRAATIAWAIYAAREPDGRPPPDLDEALASEPWVAPGGALAGMRVARFVHERVAPERVALKVNTVLGLTEAVEAGIGVGPLPCFIADPRPGLTRIAEPNPDFGTGLWLLTHPELRQSPRVRAFMDFAGTELARLKPFIEGRGGDGG